MVAAWSRVAGTTSKSTDSLGVNAPKPVSPWSESTSVRACCPAERRWDRGCSSSCARPTAADRRRTRVGNRVREVARDHVHLLLSYRPNQYVSQMVQWLKGISSRVLLQEFPHLKKA